MTNYLVTGGCGFIGLNLIKRLKKDTSARIRVIDNLSVGSSDDLVQIGFSHCNVDSLSWKVNQFIVGDIRDKEIVAQVMSGADIVVHLAANTGVQPSLLDPFIDCETNVLGSLNCLSNAAECGVQKFILASSGAPLGKQIPPLHEEMAPHPMSPYGASKLAGEAYCSAFYHSFGLDACALRFGNVYGPGSMKKTSVIAKFIKQVLKGERIEIFGNGKQTRDYIYIDDLTSAIIAAVQCDGIGGEVFQIATSKETSVLELIDTLKQVFERRGIDFPTPKFSDPLVGDIHANFSDTSKAKQILKWTAQVDLADGLDLTITELREALE
jgi:UDP-glucose 4-epimerase